jgi:hypothetical protein
MRAAQVRQVVALFVAAACSDVPTGATTPFSMSFDALPSPSVVLGDTLRDSTGVPARPRATVFNPNGDVIADAVVQFLVADTSRLIRIDSVSGFVISTGTKVGSARIVASVNTLQSDPRTIAIVPRPDTVLLGVVADTVRYSFADTVSNYSAPLQILVQHRDGTTVTGVSTYVVRFSLANPADTANAWLLDDQRRRLRSDSTGRTHTDTTGADGSASRLIYLRPSERLARPVDSIVVLASVRYRTAEVAGSPVRLVLRVRPKVVP